MSNMSDTYCTFEEIEEKIRNNSYVYKDDSPVLKRIPEGHVFDEELSVKKNREMVIAHNEKVEEQKRRKLKGQSDAIQQFYDDCKSCLCGAYGWRFSPEVADKIIKHLQERDCDLFYDFLYYMDKIADLVADILTLESTKI